MAWSLANAFEKPVRPAADGGLVWPSAAALDTYWARLCAVYGGDSLERVVALALDRDLPLDSLRAFLVQDSSAWVQAVLDALPKEAREP